MIHLTHRKRKIEFYFIQLKMLLRAVYKHLISWPLILNKNITKDCRFIYRFYFEDGNIPILQERFIDFFRRDTRYNLYTEHTQSEVSWAIKSMNETVNVKEMIDNVTEGRISSFLHNLSLQRHALSSQDFQSVLLAVDDAYCEKVSLMDKENLLKCIYIWHSLCQGSTIKTKIYKEFLQKASTWLNRRNNRLEHLVYIMFYIGICKKIKEAQFLIKKCLREIGDHVNFLSLDELCIIASSSYKCSVQIKSVNLLQCICKQMIENCESLVSDPAYLVTFVKVLRLAKFYNFNVMDELASNENCSKIKEMNFTAKVHILALFAEALYDKKHFINSLIQSCIKNTCPATNNFTLRMKDISRFLWAVSYLGYDLSYLELTNIIKEVKRSVNENRHLKEPENIVSILLSLWCMGFQEYVLINDAVNEFLMKRVLEKRLFRVKARLSLLFTCIEIERPELLSKEHFKWKTRNIIPPEALEKHLEKRTFLKHVFTASSNLARHLKLHVGCGCHVPNLNILGITVTSPSGKVLHLEVLDASVCLHQTHIPHGLMKLKLRLLENLGHQVLVVNDDKFDIDRHGTRLYIFLEENFQRLQNKHEAN